MTSCPTQNGFNSQEKTGEITQVRKRAAGGGLGTASRRSGASISPLSLLARASGCCLAVPGWRPHSQLPPAGGTVQPLERLCFAKGRKTLSPRLSGQNYDASSSQSDNRQRAWNGCRQMDPGRSQFSDTSGCQQLKVSGAVLTQKDKSGLEVVVGMQGLPTCT